jgi:RNA polymerase sigma-70 factor (ECF subfamily)
LPPQQRSVYLLSRLQGMSYEEIGRELNISPNTVRNHLVKALATIRVWLEQQDQLPLFLLCCAPLLMRN